MVRLVTTDRQRLAGTVRAWSRDSLRITDGTVETVLAWTSIARMDRYYGHTAPDGASNAGGVAMGAVLGTAVGAGYGWLVGWPIGAAIGGDEWRRVPLLRNP